MFKYQFLDSRSNYNTNCVALDCPEVHNFTALQNATGVKYYSSYPYWIWANDNCKCTNFEFLFQLKEN